MLMSQVKFNYLVYNDNVTDELTFQSLYAIKHDFTEHESYLRPNNYRSLVTISNSFVPF